MHNELQKSLGKSKTNKAIRIDKIPNKIMMSNIYTVTGPGPSCCLLAVYCTCTSSDSFICMSVSPHKSSIISLKVVSVGVWLLD